MKTICISGLLFTIDIVEVAVSKLPLISPLVQPVLHQVIKFAHCL